VSARIIRSRDYPVQPWKNGLGVSRVIAAQPPDAGYDAILWQVSTTSITASCPFSSLPGLDRQFMLLAGEGVELRCRGPQGDPDIVRRVAAPFEPFGFRGDWQTDCRLRDGPVQVFNVMTRRGHASALVRILSVKDPAPLPDAGGGMLIAYTAAGGIRIDDGGGEVVAMGDAVVVEAAGARQHFVRATGEAPACIVMVFLSPAHSNAGQ
jgi:uncharacterized protein